jgi:hypothetical protein
MSLTAGDSYSPGRHWRSMFKPDGEAGPRLAYRCVMTLVGSDDDLDWEFAFDSHLGHPTRSSEEPTGEEVKEMVCGIAHLAPGCSRYRCRRERFVCVSTSAASIQAS